MKLLTFNGSLKQKEHKQSVSTHKEKKAENIFPHVRTQFNSGSILNSLNKQIKLSKHAIRNTKSSIKLILYIQIIHIWSPLVLCCTKLGLRAYAALDKIFDISQFHKWPQSDILLYDLQQSKFHLTLSWSQYRV